LLIEREHMRLLHADELRSVRNFGH